MAAEYIIRLDDACPSMDTQRWQAVETLLVSRGIRPIAAVVPANADPELVRGPVDVDFWQRARSWSRAGWMIGLHGYTHVLRPSAGGLVPVQRRSEFVGLPIDEQRRRIRAGVRILESNGLDPEAWVAPAHGFDAKTLQALRLESEIRIISDGFMRRAVNIDGFVWLPQQLWRPRVMERGLWTICLHPDTLGEDGFRSLESFLESRHSFPDPREVAQGAVPYRAWDGLFPGAFGLALRIKRVARRVARRN